METADEMRQMWKGNMRSRADKLSSKAERLAERKGSDAAIVTELSKSARKAKWRQNRMADRERKPSRNAGRAATLVSSSSLLLFPSSTNIYKHTLAREQLQG